MKIIRESFEETMAAIQDELNREKFVELEDEGNNLAWKQQMSLVHQEKLTDKINLEDELANAKASLILTENNEIKIANQPIKFRKIGKTSKPFLLDIELKGPLKRAFISKAVDFSNPQNVTINGKAFIKYTFQYGPIAYDFFTDSIQKLSGFFKPNTTATINRTQRYDYAKTYNREEYTKIEASAFPEMEEQAHERALELLEELATLTYRSEAAANAIRVRTDDRISELEERIIDLERELEEAKEI